ncbi:MAG: deoxyribonuclease IV [Chlamydiales bacterium]|nr:deoxyribonuclease IV [Chlamydiales bacterium]
MQKSAEKLLIGAHTSAAGGAYRALLEGKSIGATTIQFFTANQRRWASKPLDQESIDLWYKTLEETKIRSVMSHASYLLNLGAPNPDNLQKSRHSFKEELMRCISLGVTFLNFHPGASLDESKEACLDKIIESILSVQDLANNGPTTLLLETTAGQGSCVGASFEELAYIIAGVKKYIPIGVCVDTCHIFAAGYDIRTKQSLDNTLKQFDEIIGLSHLKAFHLNDSLGKLGSRKDRHKPLGAGEIGIECFKCLMQDPRTCITPKYLETPDGPPLWKEEIKMLREFYTHHS